MNKIIITGRLGDDPKGNFFKSKNTQQEMVKASFNLAVKTMSKDNPLWLQIQVFNALAEKVVIPYVKKGDMVLIEGELRQNSYEGKKYYYVLAEKIEIISSKKQDVSQIEEETNQEDEVVEDDTNELDLIL